MKSLTLVTVVNGTLLEAKKHKINNLEKTQWSGFPHFVNPNFVYNDIIHGVAAPAQTKPVKNINLNYSAIESLFQ